MIHWRVDRAHGDTLGEAIMLVVMVMVHCEVVRASARVFVYRVSADIRFI